MVDYDTCIYVYGYTCGVGDIYLYVDDGGWVLEDSVSQSMLLADYEMVIESGKDYKLNMCGISQLVDTYLFSCTGDHVQYSYDRCIYPPLPTLYYPMDPIILWEGYNYNIVLLRDEHGNYIEDAQVAIYDQTNSTYIQKWTPNPDGYLLLGALFNDSNHNTQVMVRTFDGVFTLETTYPANGSFGGYRKPITLTGGSSGAQTNYQLNLSIQYESDMQADFDDLRFTQSDGTLVDAWLESKIDSTSAEVWVEFPTTPASGVNQTYYVCYGNSTASSNWDSDATFLAYDDFEGASIDSSIWDLTITSVTTSSDRALKGTKSAKFVDGGKLGRTLNTSDNIAIKYWAYFESAPDDMYPLLHGDATSKLYTIVGYPSAGDISYHDGSWHDTGVNAVTSTWASFEAKNFVWASHTQDILYNDIEIASDVGQRSGNEFDDRFDISSSDTNAFYIDCFMVQKYASGPPTSTIGSEQILTSPGAEDITQTNMTIPIHYNIQMDTQDQFGTPLTGVFCGLAEYAPYNPLSFWGYSMGGRQYVPVTNCSGFAMCDIIAEKGGYVPYEVTALNWTSRSAMVKDYRHEIVMVKE